MASQNPMPTICLRRRELVRIAILSGNRPIIEDAGRIQCTTSPNRWQRLVRRLQFGIGRKVVP